MNKESIKKGIKNVSSITKEFAKKSRNAIVKKADQNADETFDKEDLKLIGNKINAKAQNAAAAMKKGFKETKKEIDLKIMKPIFKDSLQEESFSMSKMICVTETDKKYIENEACKGAIGYKTYYKNMNIITIFSESLNNFDIELYPDKDSVAYFIDPANNKRYIALDIYFDYLKEARVNELERIAQDLGAKHFTVSLIEDKKTFTKKSKEMKADYSDTEYEELYQAGFSDRIAKGESKRLEVSGESSFEGHAPRKPELVYLKNEPHVKTLIDMRMNDNTMTERRVIIKLNRTSGMKRTDALYIDGALKSMKISGNTTIENEYNDESRKYFEYKVEF